MIKLSLIALAVVIGLGAAGYTKFRHHETMLHLKLQLLAREVEGLKTQKSTLEKDLAGKNADWETITMTIEELDSVQAQVDQYIQLLPALLREFSEKKTLAEGYQKAFTTKTDLNEGQTFDVLELRNGETYSDVRIGRIANAEVSFWHAKGMTRKSLDLFPDALAGETVERPAFEGYYLKDFATFVREIPEILLVGAFEDQVDDFREDQRILQRKLEREARQMELKRREQARQVEIMQREIAGVLGKPAAPGLSASERAESEIFQLNNEIERINYAILVSYSRYNGMRIRTDRTAFHQGINYKLAEITKRQRRIADLGGTYASAVELPAIERPVSAVRACSGSS